MGNSTVRPPARVTVGEARPIFKVIPDHLINSAWMSAGMTIGNKPFLSALPLKMSAKDVLMMALNPYCTKAHGACSRELPQPKLSPVIRICAPLAEGLFSGKSGFGEPSAR